MIGGCVAVVAACVLSYQSAFTVQMLQCQDGTPYPMEWCGRAGRAVRLAQIWGSVAPDCGEHLRVSDGYWSPGYVRRHGLPRNHPHALGRAMNLTPTRGCSLARLVRACRVARERGYIDRMEVCDSSVHVEIREP